MCDNPEFFPHDTVKIIDEMGRAPTMAFRYDCNEATILQFYATCHFGPGNVLTWMTDDNKLSATYEQFVQALEFPSTGHKIHDANLDCKPPRVLMIAFVLSSTPIS